MGSSSLATVSNKSTMLVFWLLSSQILLTLANPFLNEVLPNNNFNSTLKSDECRFAPGQWICTHSWAVGCTGWDQEWVIEDFSGDGSGSMLAITYKYSPPCKCQCPDTGTICNQPCHAGDCDYLATCSNGRISGSFVRGDRAHCGSLTGLVTENAIAFDYGGSAAHCSK